MNKSVLIIDTPTNCFECPCFMEIGWRCQCRLDIDEDVHDGKPDWCPLAEEPPIEAIPINDYLHNIPKEIWGLPLEEAREVIEMYKYLRKVPSKDYIDGFKDGIKEANNTFKNALDEQIKNFLRQE